MRWALLWLGLAALYGAAATVHAAAEGPRTSEERRVLLTAASIAADGDLDVAGEGARAPVAGGPQAGATRPPRGTAAGAGGAALDPRPPGFAALLAPAWALGGRAAVQAALALAAAGAFVLAAGLARRLVPEPWATGGAALAALSPPALAHGVAVLPGLAAGALLAGAALLALRAHEGPRNLEVLGAAGLLALLPWLGAAYVLPAVPVAAALALWTAQQGRRTLALLAAELPLASLVTWVTVSDVVYGAFAPELAGVRLDVAQAALARAPHLAGVWLDRADGLLRWAPALALAGLAAWRLWRSRTQRLALALPGRVDAERTAGLLLALVAGAAVTAAFGEAALGGARPPAGTLAAALPALGALAAWGLRHAPRAGLALGALTLAASAALLVDLAGGAGWAPPGTRAPWGPLEALWPRYDGSSPAGTAVAAAAALALLGLIGREWRLRRAPARAARPPGAGARR